jgi:hypothetical protein
MLQTKIQRAEVAVESCLDVARGCQGHFLVHLELKRYALDCNECSNQLDIYWADMTRHLNCLRRLDRRLQNTLNLVRSELIGMVFAS